MKALLIRLITMYQIIISPLNKQLLGPQAGCRYRVTCSEYAKIVINKYGLIRGAILAVRRILSCQPFIKIQTY